MTVAPPRLLEARALLHKHLGIPNISLGISGDDDHADGGDSYHLGKDQIRKSRHRYSVDESARDQRGLDDYASALDIGWFKVTTRRGTFTLRDFSIWLVGLCKAGDPDTRDLREVIYSPDGRTVRRWDREGLRSSGDDSHLFHTHLSEYRDADGHRMVALATRWLQRIGLLPEEDHDVAFADEKIKVTATTGTELYEPDLAQGVEVAAGSLLQLAAIWARRAAINTDTLEATAKTLAEGQAMLDRRMAVLDDWFAKLNTPQASPEQTAALLRAALGEQAGPVGRILAGLEG